MKSKIASFVILSCMMLSGCATTVSGVSARVVRDNIKKVQIGMLSQEVKSLVGHPAHVNRTFNSSGASEQWVYTEASFYTPAQKILAGMAAGNGTPFPGGTAYLNFANGKLVSMQTSQ